MPIPSSRQELIESIRSSYGKLCTDLEVAGEELSTCICIDEWTVKDLLAVRCWWTQAVVGWIDAGRRGKTPTTPAEGYRWKETPRLNADLVAASQVRTYQQILMQLDDAVESALSLIDELSELELLEPDQFDWAGKWPIARWLSINTTRQYTTARTMVRRVIRDRAHH